MRAWYDIAMNDISRLPDEGGIRESQGDIERLIARERARGIDTSRIVIDPGIGFGKRKEQNSELIAWLGQLTALDHPIMVGPSRKSFLAQPDETATKFATAAAVTASILAGAHIVRVHDVAEMRAVVHMADEILRMQAPVEPTR
jgi:dihydropteroate synthase